MKKPLQIFLFLAAFQLEVRVRASGVAEMISEPAHCVGVSAPCSFKVSEIPWSSSVGKVKISAAPGTILTEEVRGLVWKLVDGTMWIKNGPSVKVKTAAAEVEAGSGEYWVLAEKDQVTFRNISARLVVRFKDNTQLEVPRGFEVWVGGVDSNAHVQHGMVVPIRLKEHLKIWFSLYPGSKSLFLSEVQDLKDQWVDVTEQSGDIYQKVVERKLAAIESERQKIQEAKAKKSKDQSQARQQFYKKVFEQ